MPTTEFVSSTDQGQQLKVNDFVKQPTLVQTVMTKMLDKQFIADALLRQAPGAAGGVVKFYEDESLFADGIEIVAEYGEIPVAKGKDGTPRAVFTRKGGAALSISREMRDRNSIDVVNKRLRQIRNSFVKFWDDAFMQAILTSAMPTYTVPLSWDDTTSKIRYDLAKSGEVVLGQKDDQGNEFAFTPDTLVVNPLRASAMSYNDDIAKVFQGNLADKSTIYAGDIGRDVSGLRILKSWRMPVDQALVCERKTIGFISDERPLETTPMYEQRERETHRADTTRMSAVGIDAPKAGVRLLGI